MPIKNTPENFWSKVIKTDTCWLWDSKWIIEGYDMIKWHGRKKAVHRLAWELTYGDVVDKHIVIHHKCDNKLCVRPDHLFIPTTSERLWGNTKKVNTCWVWMGARQKGNYGTICVSGILTKTHRLAWELANNAKIPKGMFVCHKCDNPPCCNPDHLFLGTCQDNVNDMIQKDRGNRGTRHGNVKLTDEAIKQIKKDYIPNVVGYKKLAKKYGVSEWCIRRVVKGNGWKHITV